ncbi:MAG TPA: hypothetical protein VII85_06675 [Candidatus Krumholzibacteriaceae bacterium]
MRATFIAMLILLLPAALLASPTMGIDFGGGHYFITPSAPFTMFTGYVIGNDVECYLDASEFMVSYPPNVIQTGFEIPVGSLNLGDPSVGISITYWPPQDGWNPGWNVLCTLHMMTLAPCADMLDSPLSIVGDPATGLIQGSCWPENNIIDFTGMTSIICPSEVAVQSKTWGSIKSLF